MTHLEKYNGKIVDSLSKINMEGYWQIMGYDTETNDYLPISDQFIYYKGYFFNDLKSSPWTDETITEITKSIHMNNLYDLPLCVIVYIRPLT